MRRIRAYYSEQVNTVEIINYKTKHIIRLDCSVWLDALEDCEVQ